MHVQEANSFMKKPVETGYQGKQLALSLPDQGQTMNQSYEKAITTSMQSPRRIPRNTPHFPYQ